MTTKRRPRGDGGITERAPGVWQLQVQLPPGPDGRRRRKSVTFHGTKTAARAELARLRDAAQVHRLDTEEKRTFGAAVTAFLTLANVEATTLVTYQRTAAKHLAALADRDVSKVTVAQLDELYRTIADTAGVHAARRSSIIVRGALDVAVRYRWTTSNPARDATVPTFRRRTIAPPATSDVARLIDAATGDLAVWLRLAALTGARRGEIVALRWSDVDLDTGTLTVRSSVARLPGQVVVKTTKTGRARTLALDPTTLGILTTHHRTAAARSLAVGDPIDRDRYLFPVDPAGRRPWPPDGATRRFRTLANRLGLNTVRLHDIRHAHATQLIAAGVDVRTVAGRLGHSQASTTLNVYAAFVPAADRHAADVAADAFRAAGP